MKYIILGIKDYCKDCWHDWLRNRIFALYKGEKIVVSVSHKTYIHLMTWKEGSVWYYIQQRKIAKKVKAERSRAKKLHNQDR